jgi:hypothetical protein
MPPPPPLVPGVAGARRNAGVRARWLLGLLLSLLILATISLYAARFSPRFSPLVAWNGSLGPWTLFLLLAAAFLLLPAYLAFRIRRTLANRARRLPAAPVFGWTLFLWNALALALLQWRTAEGVPSLALRAGTWLPRQLLGLAPSSPGTLDLHPPDEPHTPPAGGNPAFVPETLRLQFCTHDVDPKSLVVRIGVRTDGLGFADVTAPPGAPLPASTLFDGTFARPAGPGPLRLVDTPAKLDVCPKLDASEVAAPFHWPEETLLAEGVVESESHESGETLVRVVEKGGHLANPWVSDEATTTGSWSDHALGRFLGYEVRAYGTCYPAFAGRTNPTCFAQRVERVGKPMHGEEETPVDENAFTFLILPTSPLKDTVRVVLTPETQILGAMDGGTAKLASLAHLTVYGDRNGDEVRARFVRIDAHAASGDAPPP